MIDLGFLITVLIAIGIVGAIVITNYRTPISVGDSARRAAERVLIIAAVYLALNLFRDGVAFDLWGFAEQVGALIIAGLIFLGIDAWLLHRRKVNGL